MSKSSNFLLVIDVKCTNIILLIFSEQKTSQIFFFLGWTEQQHSHQKQAYDHKVYNPLSATPIRSSLEILMIFKKLINLFKLKKGRSLISLPHTTTQTSNNLYYFETMKCSTPNT